MEEEPKIQLKTVIATLIRSCFVCDAMAKRAFFDAMIFSQNIPDKVRPCIIPRDTASQEETKQKDSNEEIDYDSLLNDERQFILSLIVIFLISGKGRIKQYFDFIDNGWTTEENRRNIFDQILGNTGLGKMAYDIIGIYNDYTRDADIVDEHKIYKEMVENVHVSKEISTEYTLNAMIRLTMARFSILLCIDFRGKPLPDICKDRLCYLLFDIISSLKTSESDEACKKKYDFIQNEYDSNSHQQIIQHVCGSKQMYRMVYALIDEFYKKFFLKDCQEEDSFFSDNPRLYAEEEIEQLRKEKEQLAKQNEDMRKSLQGIIRLASPNLNLNQTLCDAHPAQSKALENKEDQEPQKTLFSLVTKGKEDVFRKMMDELSPYFVKTESEHYRYEDRSQFTFNKTRGNKTKVYDIFSRYRNAGLFYCEGSVLVAYLHSHTNLKATEKTIRNKLYQKKPGPLSSPR